MTKYEEGLGLEIVKAVNNGDIIEPITYEKVTNFCSKNGILANENYVRVVLSNSTENTHSPTYKKYFERVGHGEYIILPEYRQRKYYWLNVDPTSYDWSFLDIKVGRSQTYSNLNNNGNWRKNESCFKGIRKGDMVVAYETGVHKAITTICKVVDRIEDNNKISIEFQKVKDYHTYLDIDTMKQSEELIECNAVKFRRGTLLPLEDKHFHVLERMLEDLNKTEDINDELYKAVQKSMMDSRKERIRRLKNQIILVPESYETTTKMYKRNPDVIAEVLFRANGVCEKCNKIAPFVRISDGTPYLEVHHVNRLADGGEDTVNNAIAVCPNCHRELHFGKRL